MADCEAAGSYALVEFVKQRGLEMSHDDRHLKTGRYEGGGLMG